MDELVRWLRAFPRTITNGVAALRDLLLWGQVYPRAIDITTLRRMRGRR
jgi:hypothetical protein